uniref:TSA: Wollemia nobilis Ref_Wollemi_Transcript_14037_970 transcribed RNA sequence n=1 Tax=Wollemia nobilis TaxID=56998 RepID=A0A0C9RK17_9CONI
MAMEGLKVFTMKQVSAHTTKNDCWFVIGGKVYNVTKFLEEHPGGEEVLIEVSGKDATRDFEDVGHSTAAKGMMDSYLVGVLEGFKGDVAHVKKETTTTITNKQDKAPFKEIPAFVVKDDEPSVFTKLVQFLLPLLIVGVAFGIRSFLKDSQPSQPSS